MDKINKKIEILNEVDQALKDLKEAGTCERGELTKLAKKVVEKISKCLNEYTFNFCENRLLKYLYENSEVTNVHAVFYYFIQHSIINKNEELAEKVVLCIIDFINRSAISTYKKDIYKIVCGVIDAFLFSDKKKAQSAAKILLNIINQVPNLTYEIIASIISRLNREEKIDIKALEMLSKAFENTNNQELKKLIKTYSILILSEYLARILFIPKKSSNDISKYDRSKPYEEKLLSFLQSFNIIDNSVKKLGDIRIDFLINKWSECFNSKIQCNGIDGGRFFDILLYILKDFAKGQTIEYVLTNTQFFNNFFLINENTNAGQKQIELLLEQSYKNQSTFIVYTGKERHAVVSLIENGGRKLIDSSLVDKALQMSNYYEFFIWEYSTEYFNEAFYQANGTCYLNAGLAFKIFLDLSKKEPLQNAIDDLSKIENGQQNIITEVSKEVVKLYELLGLARNSQFAMVNDSEFLRPLTFAPSTQLTQQLQSGVEVKQQVQPLNKEVQRLRIFYNNFIVQAGYLAKGLEALNYKMQYFDLYNQEISDTRLFKGSIYTSVDELHKHPLEIYKIIATREGQRPKTILSEGLPSNEVLQNHVENDIKKHTKSNKKHQSLPKKGKIEKREETKLEKRHQSTSRKNGERTAKKDSGIVHLSKKEITRF